MENQWFVMKYILLIFAFGFGFLIASQVLKSEQQPLDFRSWLNGHYCEGFCWQQVTGETTLTELETLLNGADVSDVLILEHHVQWTESQDIVNFGTLEPVSVIFSDETNEVIGVLGEVDVCLSTIVGTFGIPNLVFDQDGHQTFVYVDVESGSGWTFNTRTEILPFVEVAMRVENSPDFSLDMSAVDWERFSHWLDVPCRDPFSP